MKLTNLITLPLLLISPLLSHAQAEIIFNDIHLNESVASVTQKLSEISETSNIISVDDPSFPLAKTLEAHLVCTNINTRNGTITRAVFTFADNKLSYIEARGNVLATLAGKRTDTARTYMQYDVYFNDKLFINKKKDIAWILTDEAMHPNLFTWENPYLNDAIDSEGTYKYDGDIPAFLTMGASIDDVKPLLEINSSFTNTEELDGSDPNAQLQINCFGVTYLGFPRKIEARFGDDKLNVVWILTGKGEEDRIRKALTNQYGNPIFVNDEWEIFDNWQVGLRKDKPEVLLMEQQIGLDYKTSYFKQ
jgi:hypothetical protein